MTKFFILLISLLTLSAGLYAANRSTQQAGDWNNPATWGGTLPANGDKIEVNHAVTITSNINFPSAAVSVGWSGCLTQNSGTTVVFEKLTMNVNPANAAQCTFAGTLTVKGNFSKGNGHLTFTSTSDVTFEETFSVSNGTTTIAGKMTANGKFATSEPLLINTNGDVTINNDLENNGGSTSVLTVKGKLHITHDLINTGEADLIIIGGNVAVDNDFKSTGSSDFSITNNGSMNIGGDLSNSGNADFNIVDASLSVAGNFDNSGSARLNLAGAVISVGNDFTNSGGAAVAIDSASAMTIANDYTNSATTQIDGDITVGGTLESRYGGYVQGAGSIDAGNVIDKAEPHGHTIDPNFMIISGLYVIADGEWSDGAIWSTDNVTSCNCTPSVRNRVTIEGHAVTIATAPELVRSLVVESGAALTLNSGINLSVLNTLIVNGDFTMKSGATLLNEGAIAIGTTANVVVERYVSGPKYHYFASPFANTPLSVLQEAGAGVPNPNVYAYDETLADHWGKGVESDGNTANDFLGWVAPDATLTPAKGYIVNIPYNFVYYFTGTAFNFGDVAVNVTNTDNFNGAVPPYDGWNIVGNPYPSNINIETFIDNNLTIDGNVYFWDDPGTQGGYASNDYAQVNKAGSILSGGNGTPVINQSIAVGQGFSVRSLNSSGSVTFTNAMRVADNANFFKGGTQTANSSLTLSVSNADRTLYNEILVALIDTATTGFDRALDGYKRKGNSNIALYSMLGNQPMGIQSLPTGVDFFDVVVGFDVAVAGVYSFEATNYSAFDEYTVTLIDSYTATQVVLNETPAYSFSAEAGIATDRFVLRYELTSAKKALLTTTAADNVAIYASGLQLFVNQSSEVAKVKVFDVLGRLVISQALVSGTNTFVLPAAATYVVHYTDSTGQRLSKKVVAQ